MQGILEPAVARDVRIAEGLAQLDADETKILRLCASGQYEGGQQAPPAVYAKFVELGLIFRYSGRLRPDVYKMLLS